jgi:type II secretory pathway pseudopilin PulG
MRTSTKVHDETGGTLILALVYIIIVGMVVGALGGWISNDLNNSGRFNTASTEQSAARSTTEVAMQSIRYTPLIGAGLSQTVATPSSPSYCWGSSSPSQLAAMNGYTMSAWCSTVFNSASTATRVVTFSVCLSTISASACAASPLLQAVVTFDDYPATGGVVNSGACTSTCGETMTINSWLWN